MKVHVEIENLNFNGAITSKEDLRDVILGLREKLDISNVGGKTPACIFSVLMISYNHWIKGSFD